MPRARSSTFTPARLRAVRWPAIAWSDFAVHLHSAHAQAASRGKDFEFFFFLDGAGNQRSGDHGAEAFHGEHAIDGQAEDRRRVFRGDFGGRRAQFAFEIVKPGARGAN